LNEVGLSWVRQFADWRLFASLRARPPGEKRFLLLVPLTGVATGFASVALIRLLGLVQQLFWGSRHELLQHALLLPAWQRFAIPTIGGALLGLVILIARQPVGGHGTSGIIEAVAQRSGFLPLGRSLIQACANIITVGSGGSLGREGSLVRVGAALGSLFGRRFNLGGNRLNILVGCGAAAGIATAYNAPIGGALFALEVVLGNFALESFGPIVVASAIGTVSSGRWSWYNEVGVKYFEPRQPDTSFIGSGGFKAKTELRYYLKHKRGSHRPIKPMDGMYLAANAFYTYNSFNTQINYLTGNNNTESKTDCFGVRKTAWGANLVFGWQKSLSRRVFVDLYGGAGVRLRYVRDTHKEYDPDRDILIKSIDVNIRSIQDEVNSKDGFSVAPNLTLGVRLCYRL